MAQTSQDQDTRKRPDPPKWAVYGCGMPVMLIGLAILVFFGYAFVTGVANSAKQSRAASQTPEGIVKKVLGEPRDDSSSGVLRIVTPQGSNPWIAIDYRYFPVGMLNVQEEIGIDLAPKIRRLYEASQTFDEIRFEVFLPFSDTYGNRQWRSAVMFTMDRQVYTRINWDNFASQNLLRVAKNVSGRYAPTSPVQ